MPKEDHKKNFITAYLSNGLGTINEAKELFENDTILELACDKYQGYSETYDSTVKHIYKIKNNLLVDKNIDLKKDIDLINSCSMELVKVNDNLFTAVQNIINNRTVINKKVINIQNPILFLILGLQVLIFIAILF